MSTQPTHYITPEEYLEIERKAEFKSEYYQGQMFAMSGASLAHNRIVMAVSGELRSQLRRGPCEAVSHDMRVVVSATGLYVYPDVCVFCGEPQLLDGHKDTLLNPTVIIEVLSPSTEAYDRGAKFKHYRTVQTLREYLLIASECIDVELRRLRPDGEWIIRSVDRLEDSIELESIGCRLALADIYEKVEFANPGRPDLPVRP